MKDILSYVASRKYVFYTLCSCFILAILPFVWVLIVSKGNYPTVPMEIMDDSLYYYNRAVEVSQGHVFVGNPYSMEHKDGVTVAFFVADWIWSVPLLLGFSIGSAIIINQLVWFLIMGYLFYLLLERFRLKQKYIPWVVSLIILFAYWYLARPVAMQIVFPVFVLWIISLYDFLTRPHSRSKQIFLALTTALSLYVYTYMTQVVAVSLFLACVATFHPHFKKYRSIWFSMFGASLLSFPFFIYTWKQITAPYYFETLTRIGLVYTHTFGFSAILYGVFTCAVCTCVYIYREIYTSDELSVFFLVSIGLFVATLSNVITGKDLELAVHIGRFVELWSVIALCVFAEKIYSLYSRTQSENFFVLSIKKTLYAPALICFVCILYIFPFQIGVWKNINPSLLFAERYSGALEWINNNTKADSVIFADNRFSSYVPLVTNDYVSFHSNTLLYLASDAEIKARYALSRIFEPLSVDDAERDIRTYAGAGISEHQWRVHNRSVLLCHFVHANIFGHDCGQPITQEENLGPTYVTEIVATHDAMQKDVAASLKVFHVSYIVRDNETDHWVIPPQFSLAWSDATIDIFQVK